MKKNLLLIRHEHDPMDDRVSTWAVGNGFEPLARRPFAGESLGDLDDTIAGCVVYGGKFEAYETEKFPFLKDEARMIEACMSNSVPLLGICQGAQQIAHVLGAPVGPPEDGLCEFGYYQIRPTEAGKGIIPDTLHVTQSHFHTFGIASGAERLASSDFFPNQAFRYGETTYAFQFHGEVTIEGFRRWQATSSNFGKAGAQDRAEQDALMHAHDAAQAAWFYGFLDGLFAARA
jgi:GMP synthase (glutamine-hydrolysing)